MNGFATRDHQRGWAGIIVLLLVLLVIAIVGQKMLREYGLTTKSTISTASSPKPALGPTDAGTGAAADPAVSTPVPTNAIERARGVEATIQQQADEAAKRIDEQTR